MALRIILVGLVSALGWELPTRQDLQHAWEKGVSYYASLRADADRAMPDGVEAFLADPIEEKTEEVADVFASPIDEPSADHDFSKMCVINNCLDCNRGRIATHTSDPATIVDHPKSAVAKTTEIKIGPITIIEEELCETTEKVAKANDSAATDADSLKIDAAFVNVVDEMERRFCFDAAIALGRIEPSSTSEAVDSQKTEAKVLSPATNDPSIASTTKPEPVANVDRANSTAQVVAEKAIEPFEIDYTLYPGLTCELYRAEEGGLGPINGTETVAKAETIAKAETVAKAETIAKAEPVAKVEPVTHVGAAAQVEEAATAVEVTVAERVSPSVEVERRAAEVATSEIRSEPASLRPTTTTRFAIALRMTGQALEAWATFLQGPTDLASTGQLR